MIERWREYDEDRHKFLAADGMQFSINQSINQHELAMAPHIQSSGAPEIQWK